jgi:hypothetical protein
MTVTPKHTGIYRAVESLDGTWFCLADPNDEGRTARWFTAASNDACPAHVPGVIQRVFPGYQGVAWYWCEVMPSRNPNPDGRYLLRFEAADYRAEVWVNGERISTHDGAQTPFVFDITDNVRLGERNLIAVRVVNPGEETVDGLSLAHLPRRNRATTPGPGSSFNYGGLIGSVELLSRPSAYIAELIARPNPATGVVSILALVLNTLEAVLPATINFAVAPAAGGETLQSGRTSRQLQPGQTLLETLLPLPQPRKWDPADPCLYSLTARLIPDSGGRGDAVSTRFAFRDFRFADGHFRLNGRRFLWKGVRTLNNFPADQPVPLDARLYRQELRQLQALGFNAVRFMAGLATTRQLELCDEMGLLVVEETQAAWNLPDAPETAELFDRSLRDMVLRDRNHPSIVAWGLLTDAPQGPVLKHAVEALPMISFLDDTRLIFLNSGRTDGVVEVGTLCNPKCTDWEPVLPASPQSESGDVHLNVSLPLTAAEAQRLRTLGEAKNEPVFISDWRIPGPVDLLSTVRQFEKAGRAEADDAVLCMESLHRFMRDWDEWKMEAVFARAEDFFRAVCARATRRQLECVTALRANPRLAGVTVGLADDLALGSGVLNAFREPRPGSNGWTEALAPLRWCLFAEPAYTPAGGNLRIEAMLANEDDLLPGEYPLLVQLFDPNQSVVFERRSVLEIPAGKELPLAVGVCVENVPLDGPGGRWRLTATFEHGAEACAGEIEILVADAPPPLAAEPPIKLLGEAPTLKEFFTHHGIDFSSGDPQTAEREREIIVAVMPPPDTPATEAFDRLADRAQRGATVLFISPEFFRAPDGSWLPAGELATVVALRLPGEPIDAWATNHSIFAQGSGLLDDRIYRELLPLSAFIDLDPGGEVISAAHLCTIHPDQHRSGVLLSIHPHGEGRIILSAFRLIENLGLDPAADRMLLDLLRFAGQQAE